MKVWEGAEPHKDMKRMYGFRRVPPGIDEKPSSRVSLFDQAYNFPENRKAIE